jgi:hypothetical protein
MRTVRSALTGAVAISSIWALAPIAEYASVLVLATIGVAGTSAEITVTVSDTVRSALRNMNSDALTR